MVIVMNNRYGKTLKKYLLEYGIKEQLLAGHLGYDVTYINKWINGNNLPSSKNSTDINKKIADFLMRKFNADFDLVYSNLKEAYSSDYIYKTKFSNDKGYNLQLLTGYDKILELITNQITEINKIGIERLAVISTFDLISIWGEQYRSILLSLFDSHFKSVQMDVAINYNDLHLNYSLYCDFLLSSTGCIDNCKINISKTLSESPKILIINEILYMQILWAGENEIYAIFSRDSTFVKKMRDVALNINRNSEKIFLPVDPTRMKLTNVQLDSYSDQHQKLLFNTAPPLLFPEDVMHFLISSSKSDEYAEYLKRLGEVFRKSTSKSDVDLILMSSKLKEYTKTGLVKIGNVDNTIPHELLESHIKYLIQLIKTNKNFHLYIIRDTLGFNSVYNKLPSIFIDSRYTYIENTDDQGNSHVHMSGDSKINALLGMYFNHLKNGPVTLEASGDMLERYL